jgi:hypothetical protein
MKERVSPLPIGELGAIDRLDLLEVGNQHRDAYRNAAPWSHIALDGLFDPEVVAQAMAEELGPALQLVPRRSNRAVKAYSPSPAGPTARAILDRLLADDVRNLLTALTGISDLVVDPTRWLGGLHVLAPGSFQKVHRDFARHATRDLWHRVNVLVYLNSGWRSQWGGQLELWDPEMAECRELIEPTGGRLVVFESTPEALHGIPRVVRCPTDNARLSLVSYYYTADPGPHAGRRYSKLIGLPRRPGERITASVFIPFDPLRRIRERAATNRSRNATRR